MRSVLISLPLVARNVRLVHRVRHLGQLGRVVVVALVYPFALRTGLTTAPLREVAEYLGATG